MIICKRILAGARARAAHKGALAPFYLFLILTSCTLVSCSPAAPVTSTAAPAGNTATMAEQKPKSELVVVYDPTPDIEAITKAIKEELDPLKNPTEESVGVLVSKVDEQSLLYLSQNLDTNVQECLVHLLRGFDYTVGDVSVEDNTATAAVTITCLDGVEAMEAAKQQVLSNEEMQTLATLYASGDDEDWVELVGHLVEVVYENLDSTTTMVTKEIQLSFTKQDSVWTVDPASLETLATTITAGVRPQE